MRMILAYAKCRLAFTMVNEQIAAWSADDTSEGKVQQNHYTMLDVPFCATRKEITAGYHKQMHMWHPDKFQGTDKTLAERYARDLNHAYSILSDPQKREEYDRSLRVEAMQSQIMERYVSGASGWNLDGKGPLPADAPRRPMTAQQKQEMRLADRNASRTIVVTFGFVVIAGLVLLLVFSIVNTVLGAVF